MTLADSVGGAAVALSGVATASRVAEVCWAGSAPGVLF